MDSKFQMDSDDRRNILGRLDANGIIGMIQKIPFCHFAYTQMEGDLLALFLGRSNTVQIDDFSEDVSE